ncbi:phosphate ABC transporter permease PstA [Nodosilinea sp. LEGE 07088]|uniref:phosphate ABC transporter permease PstA n=1 Tax=Nodosilinea sp. LEGE 07088 TaxID=2777968 RepID=UPI0018813878|nr:phosphate ABC transporter permease PstA [Nodosilinea sp. LEGE 07088]MBE9141217.1 phosphate ABC transporter permease PstA [Nodosilinea sp. LEGE 07088]
MASSPSKFTVPSPGVANSTEFAGNLPRRYALDRLFQVAAWVATAIAIAVLSWLLYDIFSQGWDRLNWQFLTSFPSRRAENAGIIGALAGTFWVMIIVAVVTFPVGVGAGIYLEEFSSDNWFTRLIEINISNLAGVPSIIYGLLGLAAFVRILGPITGGRSVLSGALTLALLVLPIVIVATREALRAVPDGIRQAGLAMGGSRWQVVWDHVLPAAISGILTGVILALSRAIGETAPLITIGALTFVPFTPGCTEEFPYFNPLDLMRCPLDVIQSPFTVMPIQVFNWISRPQAAFHENGAAAIIVLLVMLVTMNSLAIVLRHRLRQPKY